MINYVKGDATRPVADSTKIIVHCCNDAGAWGAGFVLALSKRWPFAEEAYRAWFAMQPSDTCLSVKEEWHDRVSTTGRFGLGEVQFVHVAPQLTVANLIGQHGINMMPNNRPPIRYEAIQRGLQQVWRFILILGGGSVHMGRMGSGLAGGRWDAVEKLVDKELSLKGVSVTVYDLPESGR